jgi:hypothetical protein
MTETSGRLRRNIHVPCNAVVRILRFLSDTGRVRCDWVSDPSSVVNWIARAGLGLLDAVAPSATPWIAIVDSSIAYGKAKMLVCLRVRAEHFSHGNGAVGLADVECVGLEIRESWTGEDVKDFLAALFDRVGDPVAILKDQGPDLLRGVSRALPTAYAKSDWYSGMSCFFASS